MNSPHAMGVGTTLAASVKQPTLVAGVKHQGKHMVGGSGGMTLSWVGHRTTRVRPLELNAAGWEGDLFSKRAPIGTPASWETQPPKF